MVTFRRPKNLRDLLIRADVKKRQPIKAGCKTCNKHCAMCNKSICYTEIEGTYLQYKFKIRHHLNCQSKYIIYMLQCHQCGIQYVGQTSNSLNTRVIAHMTGIRKRKDTSVSKHFNSQGHSQEDLRVVALCRTS